MNNDRELNSIVPIVYEELRALAGKLLDSSGPNVTLQTTALAHEAYLRLREQRQLDPGNRDQFFALASRLIRRVLVDHARRRGASKRSANRFALVDELTGDVPRYVEALSVAEALESLEAIDPRKARLVELRFFGGFSVPEAASILNVSERTAALDWKFARAWLRKQLATEGHI